MQLFRLISSMVFGLSLVACGQSSGPSVSSVAPQAQATSAPTTSAPPTRQIGLVMKTLTDPFFIEMEKGARRAEKDLGVTLIVKTAAQETSIEQQIQPVNDWIGMTQPKNMPSRSRRSNPWTPRNARPT